MIVAGRLTDVVGARWVWGAAAIAAGVASVLGFALARRAVGHRPMEAAAAGARVTRKAWTQGGARRGGSRRRPAGARTGDHAGRELRPARLRHRPRALPAYRQRVRRRRHRAARRRQVEPDLRARPARARRRPERRRRLGRPVEPVLEGRAARRPDPPDRPLPRSRRLHPLDGHARPSRRARRGDAAGAAAPRRVGQGPRLPRDRRRRAGRGRGDLDRRHRAARADAGFGRLDPGAEGRDHGDPRRDRDQQAGSPCGEDDAQRGALRYSRSTTTARGVRRSC